jgi:beta-lactamase regulating signal transducer with metallopeptidase domain
MTPMIAMVVFSGVAALLVFLAGRGDKARDPRLTLLALGLLAVFPLLGLLPKLPVLPVSTVVGSSSGFPWMNVLLVIWAGGFVVATVRLGLAAKGISNWRKRSQLVARVDRVEIRKLSGLKGPVAAGVIRPVVFVPEGWRDWSEETRGIVLDHEMSHLRRRDPLWRWIAEISCAVNGYNPLVIWMARRLSMQCEFACDAMVLQKGVRPGDYARVLCDLAQDKLPCGPVLAMAGISLLEARVGRLMAPRTRQGSIGLVTLVGLTLAFAGALVSLGPRIETAIPVSKEEIELRWKAQPFPGER